MIMISLRDFSQGERDYKKRNIFISISLILFCFTIIAPPGGNLLFWIYFFIVGGYVTDEDLT